MALDLGKNGGGDDKEKTSSNGLNLSKDKSASSGSLNLSKDSSTSSGQLNLSKDKNLSSGGLNLTKEDKPSGGGNINLKKENGTNAEKVTKDVVPEPKKSSNALVYAVLLVLALAAGWFFLGKNDSTDRNSGQQAEQAEQVVQSESAPTGTTENATASPTAASSDGIVGQSDPQQESSSTATVSQDLPQNDQSSDPTRLSNSTPSSSTISSAPPSNPSSNSNSRSSSVVPPIQFSSNSAESQVSIDESFLTAAKAHLAKGRAFKIEVVGHASSEGDPGNNNYIATARAEAVKQSLIAAGLPSDAIIARGDGSKSPIGDNSTPEGRIQNRRAEVYFIQTGN